MGCISQCLENCFKNKQQTSKKMSTLKKISTLEDIFEDCKKDPQSQFLKTKNGKSNSTYDSINSESKSSGIKSILEDKYLENNKKLELANFKVKCQNCEKKNKILTKDNKSDANLNEKFKYCIECKQFFCENCWTEKHTSRNEEMKEMIEHKFIPYIKKIEKCPKHGKEIIYYCDDCEEKCCEDDKEHDKHERRPISNYLAENSEKEGTFDKNMLLAMIANQNKNDSSNDNSDYMNDYIKNTLNKKFKKD